MAFSSILDPLFGPLLAFHPALSIGILAFLISLLITVIYKLVTNQDLMKQLKTEMKEFQKEIKMLKDNPKKAMAVQKRAMETNLKYMGHSMKSTFITLIPIILIFGWMNTNLAYEPISPGEEFIVKAFFEPGFDGEVTLKAQEGVTVISDETKELTDGMMSWTIKGDAGDYLLGFEFSGKIITKNLLITEGKRYSPIEERYSQSELKRVKLGNAPLKPMGSISILGWHPGWLGYYIILSIIFSMALRKILKVY